MQNQALNHKRKEAVVGEQRLYERLPGKQSFRMTSFDGVRIPAAEEFQAFDVFDYSRDGFSFVTLEKPALTTLVVELQYRERCNYHEAKIMHFTASERDGVTSYLVGCRFCKRLEVAATATPVAVAAPSTSGSSTVVAC